MDDSPRVDQLDSDRLLLVAPNMAHQPFILEAVLESQHTLAPFMDWLPHALTESSSIENTQQAIDNFDMFINELRYSIFEKSTGQLVGVISLMIRNIAIPYFEIGYWLRSSKEGLGYMSEAVRTLERYAFNDLNAKRVEIKTAYENTRSRAVAERCGYHQEAMLTNDRILPSGTISSTVVYAKVAECNKTE
ncbi:MULTISPECIES: GNAT family protein [Salinivibrio]|uniref:GNAT family N-acetyltransferase n=1 Tax=Salinivibrio TaxID=51366 RepID=UPI000395C315|nr:MULTISPECIES: GNAT family protein [Salinivibrio]